MELHIPESQLQPQLISCRLYDSTQNALVQGHRTRLRQAQSYEFSIYLTEGGTLCLPDGDHPITRGLCRLVPPGTQLCSVPHYQSYTVYFSLAPEQDGQLPHCHNPFLDSIPLCFTSRMADAYLPILDQLEAVTYQTEPGAELVRRELLCRLLLTIHKDVSSLAATATDAAVEAALQHLEQNLCQEVHLEALGELTGYHPLYLQRIFKQRTGTTPHGYLTALRLRNAKELLATTVMPVAQVAQQCGYGSVSHFTTLFKKDAGCTPLAYRKRCRILP